MGGSIRISPLEGNTAVRMEHRTNVQYIEILVIYFLLHFYFL